VDAQILAQGGAGLDHVAAGAGRSDLDVVRMDIGFHGTSSSRRAAIRPYAEYRTQNRRRMIPEQTLVARAPATGVRLLRSPAICQGSTVTNLILRLALPSPLRRLFDYRAPPGVPASALQPGTRLRVPFGRREVVGVLVETAPHSDVPEDKLKAALQLLDSRPLLPPALFRLCLWAAQ